MKNIIEECYKFMQEDNKEIAIFADYRFGNKTLTYGEVKKYIIATNGIVGTNNYTKRIGILIENKLEFVKAFFSILYNGYTVVGIDPKITEEGLDKIINENELNYIITNNTNVQKLSKYKDKININIEDLNINNIKENKISIPNSKIDDIIIISYTSGTSGKFSKGVKLSNKSISFVSEEYRKVYKLDRTSKIITVLPLWHNYAMFACLTSAMMSNSEIIIMEKWDIENFIYINNCLKPDIFPGSPYMYIDIINRDLDSINLSSLRICDSGGDSLPIECIKKFEEKTNAIITEGYGLTETASLTHFNYSAKERKIGSLGKCVTDVKCKITDLNGNEIEKGRWGLLWINGPMVFDGYVNNDKLTKEVLKDNWFNTNDVVKVDDDGYYYIAGRLSDIKNYKQNEITLREIENILYKFDGIKRVFVKKEFNKETDFYYYNIYAILKENYDISNLYDYIKKKLSNIVVNNVEILVELPTTGTGKVKRNKLV